MKYIPTLVDGRISMGLFTNFILQKGPEHLAAHSLGSRWADCDVVDRAVTQQRDGSDNTSGRSGFGASDEPTGTE
jgi:hypothetical protein